MLWDPFLMKVLVKKEVCESCEQCTGSTGKDRNAFLKKKKKKCRPRTQRSSIQMLICNKFLNFLKLSCKQTQHHQN